MWSLRRHLPVQGDRDHRGVEMKEIQELNVLIAGIGGQGNILCSRVIASAALKQGHRVRVADTLGGAQRGGCVSSHIQIGSRVFGPLIPEGRADILVGFEPVEALRAAKFLSPKATAIVNSRRVVPSDVKMGKARYPDLEVIVGYLKRLAESVYVLDAMALAEKVESPVSMNIVMLGALAGVGKLPIQTDLLRDTMLEWVPERTREHNIKAFDLGIDAIARA